MIYRLAYQAGRIDVEYPFITDSGPLIDQIPEEQVNAWISYQKVESPDYGDNWRAGIIASAIYNVNRTKRSDKVWTPYDLPLGLSKKRDGRRKGSQPMNKEEWNEMKAMLKLCGKPRKK